MDASMEVRLLREEDWDGRTSCLWHGALGRWRHTLRPKPHNHKGYLVGDLNSHPEWRKALGSVLDATSQPPNVQLCPRSIPHPKWVSELASGT